MFPMACRWRGIEMNRWRAKTAASSLNKLGVLPHRRPPASWTMVESGPDGGPKPLHGARGRAHGAMPY